MQLREHFLRYPLEAAALGAEQDLSAGFQLVVDYDENTEYLVTSDLLIGCAISFLPRDC